MSNVDQIMRKIGNKPIRPISDIPNQPGFKLILLNEAWEEKKASVALGGSGLHFLVGEDGFRIALDDYEGWYAFGDSTRI